MHRTTSALWDDWAIDNDVGGLWWHIKGKEGHRKFIVTWNDIHHAKQSKKPPTKAKHLISFQIVLREKDDSIEFR